MKLFNKANKVDKLLNECVEVKHTYSAKEIIKALLKQRKEYKKCKAFVKNHMSEIEYAKEMASYAYEATMQNEYQNVMVKLMKGNKEFTEYFPLYTYNIFKKAIVQNAMNGKKLVLESLD